MDSVECWWLHCDPKISWILNWIRFMCSLIMGMHVLVVVASWLCYHRWLYHCWLSPNNAMGNFFGSTSSLLKKSVVRFLSKGQCSFGLSLYKLYIPIKTVFYEIFCICIIVLFNHIHQWLNPPSVAQPSLRLWSTLLGVQESWAIPIFLFKWKIPTYAWIYYYIHYISIVA